MIAVTAQQGSLLELPNLPLKKKKHDIKSILSDPECLLQDYFTYKGQDPKESRTQANRHKRGCSHPHRTENPS
jgi:hypothetical protein